MSPGPDQRDQSGDDDATVRLPRQRVYGRPPDQPLIPAGGGMPPIFRLIALLCAIVIGVAGWFAMREPVPSPEVRTSPEAGASPGIAITLADEAEILSNEAVHTTVFRFAPNRRVLVLDFASLREQGLMLNRVAAMVEKQGQPRDRVLSDEELDAAIAAAGDTIETYYYGHDYAAIDLARFFAAADRDGVTLRTEEEWLRRLLVQEGLAHPGANGAVITIPKIGAGEGVDALLRATILRHELSHAEFFTNPHYAEYVRRFWHNGLDDHGRDAFRRYLAAQGYDLSLEDLMANEMQAYLMHTADKRLFSAASLGVAVEQIDRWQAGFLLGMPNGWLRDACVSSLPSAGAVLSRPRRRIGHRAVDSTRVARALTRRPRRAASEIVACKSRK